jgi:hypothetical protein
MLTNLGKKKGKEMEKKIISIFTLVAFLIFLQSCTVYSTKKVTPDVAAQKQGRYIRVLRVMKTSGEIIQFSEKDPAYVQNDVIIGPTMETETVIIEKDRIKRIQKKGKKFIITTKDEKTYIVPTHKYLEANLAVEVPKSVSILLSEVQLVWIKEKDPGLSTLASLGATVGVIGVVFLGMLAIWALTKESCPFLYAQGPSDFELEGELYSGAIFKGIERTDYLKLHHLEEANASYLLKIANEAQETQYTDELTLLAVDHPKNMSVFAGSDGVIRTIRNVVPPISARDLKGREFREAVAAPDGLMWSSNPFDKNPDNPEDLRAGIVIQFPKPRDAERAKLIVRIGNTYWADYAFGRFLGLFGSMMKAWYEQTELDPQIKAKADNFMREQGLGLRVQLVNEGKWEDIGFFYPTGPFGIQDDILEFPVEAISSDLLTVKLDGGTFFWMIDYTAVDYSADVPVEIHALSAQEAVDETGKDVKEALLQSDDRYYVMPAPGNYAVLKYPVPPRNPDLERSFFIKSEGYYNIHPREQGPPDFETILAIRQNPDNFLKFSLLEFRKTVRASK